MVVSKEIRMRKPFSHPVYSITNTKTRLGMPLMEMRITNVPLVAHLHYNSGVGTRFYK